MELAFREDIILTAETNIELFKSLSDFIDRMDRHIEKFPSYDYSIEALGGEPGNYKARVIIKKYDNKKTELTEGDAGSYGVL